MDHDLGQVSLAWPTTRSRPASSTELSRDQPLVLVVEDDAAVSRLIAGALGAQYRVVTATDGVDGLRKALALQPDLILSDLRMPLMTGLELLRALREQAEVQDVPFLLLTGQTDDSVRLNALREGAADYLIKPCSVAEIRARVANHVSVKRARDLLRQELASTSRNLEDLARELSASRRRAQDALEVREQFLLEVAHELRTPVTNILGSAQLLLRQLDRLGTLPSERLRQLLGVMEHQASRLARLVSQSVDLPRFETGALDLQLTDTDLSSLARVAAKTLEATGTQHPVHVFAAAPVWIRVDPLRIEQVLMNLLENAAIYSPSGASIEIHVAAPEPSLAQVMVRDHGPGIPPDRRAALFDRFYQPHAGQHFAGHVGLGLGLYISRAIIEQHGGQISAEFPPDGGTQFVIRLPINAT
jgi:signal transduction histidine kinase